MCLAPVGWNTLCDVRLSCRSVDDGKVRIVVETIAAYKKPQTALRSPRGTSDWLSERFAEKEGVRGLHFHVRQKEILIVFTALPAASNTI